MKAKRTGVVPVLHSLRLCFMAVGAVACAGAAADPAAITIAGGTQYAGGKSQPLIFPLTRSGDPAYDIAVNYHTLDGSAVAGIDYTAASGTIIVPAGTTSANLPVTILPYHGGNSDLMFSLNLDAATGLGPTPSFATQQAFATGTYPYSAIAADVNGDGRPDLVVANYNAGASPGTVSVLLNTTAPGATVPSFAARNDFTTGNGPTSVAVADVNGDGRLDLIVANYSANTISVLLNTTPSGAATASFATQQTFAAGANPIQVVVADVNGDGKPDVIAASENDNTVRVLLNTTATGAATPSLAAQQAFATGTTPYSVAVADINGDGKPDVIVANFNAGTVSVLLNTTAPGAGTTSFAAQQAFTTETYPDSVAVADVNGDGRPDLIVANYNAGGSPGSVSVLVNTTPPGAATSSFATQQAFAMANRPTFVAVADINADGKFDVLVATSASQTVSVLANVTAPGAAAPSFAAERTFTTGMTPISVGAGDFNGDGKADLIVMNAGDNAASVLLNTTAGPTATLNFAAAQSFSTGHAHAITTADFNGDGKPDLAVADAYTADNNVSVLLDTTTPGASTPSFAAQQSFATGAGAYSIIARDLNGDGLPDIVTANFSDNTVSVLLDTTAPGAATPNFAAQATFATGRLPYSVAAGDLNGDGAADLVVANYLDNNVSVLFNTTAPGAATPTFASQMTFATGANPQSVALADVNGDGLLDILAANYGDATVSVLLNTTAPGATTPSFAAQQAFATITATHPVALAVADLNGDGRPDVIVTNYDSTNSGSVSVLLNTTAPGAAAPSFAVQQSFATGLYPFSVTAADLDGDGRIDLIVGDYFDSTVSVLLNTMDPGATTPSFAAQRTFGATYPYSVAIADFNGDGRPDIAAADAFVQTASVSLNTQYQSAIAGSPATGTITHDAIFANGFE